MIVCILILIVYLVRSNEGFQMRVLEDTKDINGSFDFVSIYNFIKTNYNSLNELTTQEKDTYNEIVTNIEAKQAQGYVFDINYIGDILRNASTTTTSPSSESFISIPKVSIPESTEVKVVVIDKFTDILESVYDSNGCGTDEVKIMVGNSDNRIKTVAIDKNITEIKTNSDGKLVRVNTDFNSVDDRFNVEIIQKPDNNKNELKITRDGGNDWGMNLELCGIRGTATTTAQTTSTTATTTTRPAGAPNGYILLDTNQVQFLRYYVFLSVIRGVFDQLMKVNNYYFDPTGIDNGKFINMEFDSSSGGETTTVNDREVITSFMINSNFPGYPSISKGGSSTSLPNVNVVGNMGLLNIYVDVIERVINLGLSSDSIMKKTLSVDIGGGSTLRNEITRVINDLIQQFHTYNLYYISDSGDLASYNFTLTI